MRSPLVFEGHHKLFVAEKLPAEPQFLHDRCFYVEYFCFDQLCKLSKAKAVLFLHVSVKNRCLSSLKSPQALQAFHGSDVPAGSMLTALALKLTTHHTLSTAEKLPAGYVSDVLV